MGEHDDQNPLTFENAMNLFEGLCHLRTVVFPCLFLTTRPKTPKPCGVCHNFAVLVREEIAESRIKVAYDALHPDVEEI